MQSVTRNCHTSTVPIGPDKPPHPLSLPLLPDGVRKEAPRAEAGKPTLGI